MDLRVVIDREDEPEVIFDEMLVFTSVDRETIRSELTSALQRRMVAGENFEPGDWVVVEVPGDCWHYVIDCAFNSTVELIDP